jgi:hypothetical protein
MNRFLSDHTSPCNEQGFPVGASLLAKTICQAPTRPLREQAHSHRNRAVPPIRVAPLKIRNPLATTASHPQTSPVGASLLAKTICQAPTIQRIDRPLREQAHSHNNRAVPPIRVAPLKIGNLLAITASHPQTSPVGASLLAKTICQAPTIQRIDWPLREQAHSHMS